jgi:hypothetical protein
LNVLVDGIGAGMGWLDWTTETTEKQKLIFPCFFPGFPWSIELHSARVRDRGRRRGTSRSFPTKTVSSFPPWRRASWPASA